MVALAKTAPSDLADELTAHAVASIEAADHSPFPFPHIFFRNFFPADFYRDLVRSVPSEGYDPITGKGNADSMESERGVLRRQVPQWLSMPELRSLVVGFEEAHVGHGGEGALYVRVRRSRG